MALCIKISLGKKLTLIIFGFLIALVLLELGLRLGGFIILSLQESRNLISIGRRGEYRVLCVGESTTQNQYPAFLEMILNQGNPDVKFSVIDKGCRAMNTWTILNEVEAILDKYGPDLVVAMMGINDQGEHMPYQDVSHSKVVSLLSSFKIYKLARLLGLHLHSSGKPRNDVELAWHYLNQGDLSEAERTLKQSLELNPRNYKLYAGLGWLYHNQGNFPEAENSLRKSLALDPDNDQAYIGFGWLHYSQGSLSQAEASFKKALELNPASCWAYVGLGWIYYNQGELAQAERSLKKALELDPQNEKAYIGLPWLYHNQVALSGSEVSRGKSAGVNPQSNKAYMQLVSVYLRQERLMEAEELLKNALRLNPNSEKMQRALAIIYNEMDNHQSAEEYLKKADELGRRFYSPFTENNYRKLKGILDKRGIRLICVQYPLRPVNTLKRIFADQQGIFFVDNEKTFKEAVRKDGYNAYFTDMFGGDFGHCTDKGNRLLAENIAKVILKEALNKHDSFSLISSQ